MSARSFLWTWLKSLLALAAVVVLVNLVVDPYEVFGTPRIPGINLLKPEARDHSMLTKTYQVARFHPTTVLIGSSVVYLGLNAFSPAWPAAMQPVYNYGIPGGYATGASLRTLQEAINLGGVKNAVVFLDFQNFLAPKGPSTAFTEDDRRFRFTPDGRGNTYRLPQMARDMFLSLGTMSALVDSITTIADQERPNVLNMARDGTSTEADFSNAAHEDGMHDLFAQKEAYEAERATRLAHAMAGWKGPLPDLDLVAQMISFAHAHGVKLTLAIAPHHYDASELYWRDGLWPRVEQLKIELAALVASQGGNVALWDFMDYSAFSTETVPVSGDRQTPTHWFWEPTHFRKQLGDIMVQRMFGSDAPPFGVLITPENVAARNKQIRQQRQAAVCQRHDPSLMTGMAKPPDDGCSAKDLAFQQRGPT